MTFKELEFKKVKELLSPYMELKYMGECITGSLNGYTLFTYCGEHNMSVHYMTNFTNDWDYTICKSYFEVQHLLHKIKETFLEVKFPGYHNKLKRMQDDF